MNDTSPDIAKKMREMMQKRSPLERLKMGCSMHETSKYLVAMAICENMPIYSAADLRRELFLRFYGDEFDAATKQKILEHLEVQGKRSDKAETLAAAKSPSSKLPKQQKWWLLRSAS